LDFCTYFGTYNPKVLPVSTDKLEETKLCDVLLPQGESFGNRHFLIKFSNDLNSYYLKDLGEGSGTFLKVETNFVLKNGHIVSFGENHMVVGIVLEKTSTNIVQEEIAATQLMI
jgi:hypothetical protein